jgi:hypothetical protein
VPVGQLCPAQAGELRPLLARRHPASAIAGFLDGGKRRVGSPWSCELQDAALAAWSAL